MFTVSELTDKDYHCIARHMQFGFSNYEDMSCRYCKYAVECSEALSRNEWYYYDKLAPKIRAITGVISDVFHPSPMDLLEGSWVEDMPYIKKRLTNMSFEEQQDILASPRILQEIRNRP